MEQQKTGTTTIGLLCKDAVIVAAEKKATMGYMVDSKEAQKVLLLDSHIAMSIAGSVGDAQALMRLMRAQYKLYKLERGAITVKAAATLLANVLQGNKYFPYYIQLLLGGYDSEGPHIYSLDAVGGLLGTDKYYSTGSGSPFAYGSLEAGFRPDMPVDEAISLVIKSIKVAIERDIASGGKGFTVVVINKDGARMLSDQEIKKYA